VSADDVGRRHARDVVDVQIRSHAAISLVVGLPGSTPEVVHTPDVRVAVSHR
jgi:hypothetical protein